ncbi:MAG: DUF599 domain-containing protein [Deltaproteobacteria bacterium]|nr:DUF599 domain-containing protein [Deltaproteobacteria bacterium]
MTNYDYLVLAFFVFQYLGYQLIYLWVYDSEWFTTREKVLFHYRERWFRGVIKDNNLILAIQTIRNLEMVTTFLGSITMLMVGWIVSLFINTPEWLTTLSKGDYQLFFDTHPLAVKLLVTLILWLVAFFNFIISLRITFNMNYVLASPVTEEEDLSFQFDQIQRQIRYFFIGIRAIYFSIAPLMWLIDTNLFLFTSLMATVLSFRSDFMRNRHNSIIG